MPRIGRGIAASVLRIGVIAEATSSVFTVTPADTGMSFSDSLARVALKLRVASDTGQTFSDSLARVASKPRTDSDTGVTNTDSIAVQKAFGRSATDTGVTNTDSLASTRARAISDTGTTFSDSIVGGRSFARTLTDYGAFMGRTNYVPNGGMETDISGWGAYQIYTALSRVTTEQQFGTASMKATCIANGDFGPQRSIGTMAGPGTYTHSAYVKGEGTAIGKNLVFYLQPNNTGTATTTVALTGSWQRVSVTQTVSSSDTQVNLFALMTGVVGDVFYLDGDQVERRNHTGVTYPTPYIETNGAAVTVYDSDSITAVKASPRAISDTGVTNTDSIATSRVRLLTDTVTQMAPPRLAAVSAGVATTTTTWSVTYPADVQPNDIAILSAVGWQNTTTIGASGFTTIHSGVSAVGTQSHFYKRLDGTEGGTSLSITGAPGAGALSTARLYILRGLLQNSSPVDTISSTSGGGLALWIASALTTAAANELLLAIGLFDLSGQTLTGVTGSNVTYIQPFPLFDTALVGTATMVANTALVLSPTSVTAGQESLSASAPHIGGLNMAFFPSVTDSIARTKAAPRTLSDTGVTQTDSCGSTRIRVKSDTGVTQSDSIALVRFRFRAVSDTGDTHTESLVTKRSRSVSDTGQTFSDSLVGRRTYARSLSDTGVAVSAAQIASDNFNRANGALTSPWVQVGTDNVQIVSNEITGTGVNEAIAYQPGFPADQYSQGVLPLDLQTGPAVRISPSGDAYLFVPGFNTLYKRISNSYTSIGTTAVATQVGDLVRLEAEGNQIRVYYNGGLQITATDSSLTTGQAGVRGWDGSLDDWSGGSLGVTDTITTLRTRAVSDTALTQTDTLATIRTRSASDTGVTFSDSISVGGTVSRSTSDTGITETDSIAVNRVYVRAISDTGATITDSLTTVRARVLSDTGMAPGYAAVVFDAKSTSSWVANPSWTHTPVGTPTAVIVLVMQTFNPTESITVTYGGQTMTPMANSPLRIDTGGTSPTHYAFLLNSNVPTGAQTVAVSGGTQNRQGVAVTVTGGTAMGNSAGVISAGLFQSTLSVNVSATAGQPSVVFASGFTESIFGDGGMTISGSYTKLYGATWTANGAAWFYLTTPDADGGTINASFTQDANEGGIAAWSLTAQVSDSIAVSRTYSRSTSDTGVTQTDSCGSTRIRPETDTGLTFSDSLARLAAHPRTLTDTGVTQTDALATTRSRFVSDTGTTFSDSIVRAKVGNRAITDTGLTFTDSLATLRAHYLSDTGVTQTDSCARVGIRNPSDTGCTNTDSLASARTHSTSDTGVTQTDSASTTRTRFLADTGTTFSDSIAVVRFYSRSLTDTGQTHNDSASSGGSISCTDTGTTFTDSLATLRTHSASDTGVTQTDSLASSRTRSLSDTGVTLSDSIAVTRFYFRTETDTAVTFSESLTIRDEHFLSDTGQTASDSIAVNRFYLRSTTDTGVTQTDSCAVAPSRPMSDTAVTNTDSVAVTRLYQRATADTGVTQTDTLALALARTLTDTAVTETDTLTSQRSHSITDTGVAFDDHTYRLDHLRPVADITTGTWHVTPLYEKVDEVVPDDGDFIESASSPLTDDIAEMQVTNAGAPPTDELQTVAYRIGKDMPGGDDLQFTIRLVQGTTVIQSWSRLAPDSPTTYVENITNSGDITDYSDLRLRVEAVKV